MSMKSNADQLLALLKKRRKQALQVAGIEVAGAAKRKTPVDSGRLRASIAWAADGEFKTHDDTYKGENVTYDVGAPHGKALVGTNVDYAIYVHENLEANHPVGEAKFIESAAKEKSEKVKKLMSRALAGQFDV